MTQRKEARLRELAGLLAKRIEEIQSQEPAEVPHSVRAAFRAFADTVPSVIWTAGPDGAPTFQSRHWHELFGENADWMETVHPDDRQAAAECWMEAVSTGEPYHHIARFRSISGGYVTLVTHAQPVAADCGGVAYWIGSSSEISNVRLIARVA